MIKVCSHLRSGTHFLMATLYKNFQFSEDLSEVITVPNAKWYSTDKDTVVVPWQKLFGSHTKFEECGISSNEILYIVRHPIDCLFSLWRGVGWQPTLTFEDWLIEPDLLFGVNKVQYWYDHVLSYITKVFFIKYEDLYHNNENILHIVSDYFKLKRKNAKFERIDEVVGWSPNGAKPGFCKLASEKSRELVRKVVPHDFLGYEI